MFRPFRPLVTLALCLCVSFGLLACTKKEEGGISPTTVDSELLERLPVSTVGYVFSDAKSAAYGAFKRSQWYQNPDAYLAALSEVSTEVPAAKAVLNVVRSTEIFKPDPQGNEPIVESVFFAAMPPGAGAPEFGVFSKANPPLDAAKFLGSLESALRTEGVTATREKIGGVDVLVTEFAGEVPGAEQSNPIPFTLKVLFVVLPDRIGVVSSASLAERLIKPLEQIAETDRGIRALKAQPSYQRAVARSTGVGGQFIFGFADVAALTALVKANAPAGTPGVSDGTIDDLPIETISFCRSMTEGLNDYVWVGMKEGGITPEMKADLAKAGHHPAVKNSPPNPVAILSIDGAVLRTAKSLTMKGLSPEERSQAETMTAPVDPIQGLSLVVRNAAGASPFPELSILIESDEAAKLQGTLKGLVGMMAAGGGLPVSTWQTKEIEGAKVDFMASPIGVGLFMGTVKNTLVLSTADAALSDLLGGKKAPEVEATLRGGPLKGVAAPLILFYTSGERLANFIESLQASMAMFTGGTPLVEPEVMSSIRSIGVISSAISLADDAVRVQTSYLPEKSSK